MVSNISILSANPVPKPSIGRLMMQQLESLFFKVDLFEELVGEVKDMGFQPFSNSFIYAFSSMSCLKKTRWESERKLLMSFGWSEQEFLLAFRLQPLFMQASKEKMKELMEFYPTKAYLEPSDIVKYPKLLMVSLKRCARPRCSVLEVLMSKELIKKDVNVVSALNMSKERFEKSFLTRFKEDYPELNNSYQVETTF